MQERRIEAAGVIYREGDPGEALYIVTDGEVEVLRQVADQSVRLAVLGKGAFFGETGVIRGRPRSTTVRALGEVSLIVIPRDLFLATFRDNPFVLRLLEMLCERLVQADRKLIEQRIYSAAANAAKVRGIRLRPGSRELEAQIGVEGLEVSDLPFRVGRHLEAGESASANRAGLSLPLQVGIQMSPLHFAIEEHQGRLVVRDLESHLGTLVNGRRIAHFEQSDVADLRFGQNTVQAGGLDSPYLFNVIVERADD